MAPAAGGGGGRAAPPTPLAAAVAVAVAVGVAAVAPPVPALGVVEGVPDAVAPEDRVVVGVGVPVPVAEGRGAPALGVVEGVPVPVPEGVEDGEGVSVPVAEGSAPLLGVVEGVLEEETVVEGVPEFESGALLGEDPVALLGVGELDAYEGKLGRDMVGVLLGVVPLEREEVGVGVPVRDSEGATHIVDPV